jgi:DNA-binding transcriptional regulator YbjK
MARCESEIVLNAKRLFAERGFSGTTFRNVISAADVNLVAVHYHFGSKEELFRAVVERFALSTSKPVGKTRKSQSAVETRDRLLQAAIAGFKNADLFEA